jgi:coenzyme F420-0:L-glutamate ligase/coenzyme F420-1:gamma-L-glutamate ligase
VRPGDDLAGLVTATTAVSDGDVLVLTSKVVSKSEGRLASGDREGVIDQETVRAVARRGSLVVAETRHGLVLAAAGVDASNTEPGTVVALPLDPDETARRLRAEVRARTGRNVAVVVSDTAGRPWRVGQTDIAIGCAGLPPTVSLQGTVDPHGHELQVTAPAVADEVAAAGDLVKGKVSGCPLAVVRGLAHLVLPAGDDGPGATALVRPRPDDLFGLGARDAALAAAVRDDPEALGSFPALGPDDADPFARLRPVGDVQVSVTRHSTHDGRRGWEVTVAVPPDAPPTGWLAAGRLVETVHTLAAAHRLVGVAPTAMDDAATSTGRTVVDRSRWVTS